MELVRDRWYVVLESDELPRGRPLGVLRHGERMVFWRDRAGTVHATSDRCPHRGASLALGKVHDDEIACPFHGFRFRGADGRCTAIPANGDRPPPSGYAVRAHVVREAHGYVWLWVGDRREAYPDPPWFADLDEPGWRWRAGRIREDWPVHWTRVVENQLDFTHLPFVHATSIGRFVAAPMEVDVQTDDRDWMRATVTNQPNSTIELVAPNLWRNRIGRNTCIMAVFVPLDEATTRTYVRYVQRDVPWPIVGDLYGWVMAAANRWILSQDRRVVTSQTPGESTLRGGEKLVPSDAPILWFRRWRDRGLRGDA